jgi:hypothetical protein
MALEATAAGAIAAKGCAVVAWRDCSDMITSRITNTMISRMLAGWRIQKMRDWLLIDQTNSFSHAMAHISK